VGLLSRDVFMHSSLMNAEVEDEDPQMYFSYMNLSDSSSEFAPSRAKPILIFHTLQVVS
jgi:hypothetical protein